MSSTSGAKPDATLATKRKQRVSCGACYFRRVKCDLREKIPITPAGVEPKCTNCEQRNVQCVNEFEKSAHKSHNAQLSVQCALSGEATYTMCTGEELEVLQPRRLSRLWQR